jgi:hypothetical protein
MTPRHKAGGSHRTSSKTAARPNRDAVIGAGISPVRLVGPHRWHVQPPVPPENYIRE